MGPLGTSQVPRDTEEYVSRIRLKETSEESETAMSIDILTGVPGSGKSRRLIETVNSALERGRSALTFACSDSPVLASRPSLRDHHRLACRVPGLQCPLDHFVSVAEAVRILGQTPPETLVAFEESQFFGDGMVRHWLDASARGLDIVVATPSAEQLEILHAHGCQETRFTVMCQKCAATEATKFVLSPDRDITISACDKCHAEMVAEARQEILDRLERQDPYPGEQAIYQPVEFQECSGWRVLRPDTDARVELMASVFGELGLPDQGPTGQATYLDVGSNTGYLCHRIRRLGFFVEGTDVVEGDIRVAKLLDSFFRRDHNTYVAADAYDYLRDTVDRLFDVTSAFSVLQWVMIQRSSEDGIACLEWLFAKTKRICFLEMGDSSEAHYKDRIGIDINRAWTENIMKEKGGFSEVRVFDAKEHSLKRDVFAGIRL